MGTFLCIVAIVVFCFVMYLKFIRPYVGGDGGNCGLSCLPVSKKVNLFERCAANKKALRLHPVREVYDTDHPAELVYTGATVGGIHTGGFHVNEAYTSTSLGEKTGRYFLSAGSRGYDGTVEWFVCTEIELTKELAAEAEKHPVVKKFLKDSSLILKYDAKMSDLDQGTIKRLTDRGDTTMARNVAMHAAIACYLKKEDIQAIYNWICNIGGDF